MRAKRSRPGGSSCDLASASSFGATRFFLLRPPPMPSRLRRCALPLALQGKALRAIPAALCLAFLQARRPPAAPARPSTRLRDPGLRASLAWGLRQRSGRCLSIRLS